MRLESGAAFGLRGDFVYYMLWFVGCLGVTGWFVADGAWWYLDKNRSEARKALAPLLGADKVPAELGASPTELDFNAMVQADAKTPAEVHRFLGPPKHTTASDADQTEYFYSDYGMAIVTYREGRALPQQWRWNKWSHTRDEIRAQFYFAAIPALFALYFLYRALRAARVRLTLDDQGVHYCNRPVIPLDAIAGLRDYSPKGWVDLYYRDGDGESKLRIDNQKLARFDEIIDALCQIKGLPDPRQPAGD